MGVVSCGTTVIDNGVVNVGAVNWDTTAKTSGFTAVSGNGYFIDTSSSTITVTLPASPSAGDIVYVKDYDGSFATNKCTVARNSSNIRGGTSDFTLEAANAGAVFIYVDATEGWQIFVDGSDGDARKSYIVATGGTITCCGDYKIHTFTGPGTFTVSSVSCNSANNDVDYVVVGGGGAGGSGAFGEGGGGGGAGGYRESPGTATCYTASPLGASPATAITVCATSYPIVVGGGGSGASGPGGCGVASSFSTITGAKGGGGGGHFSSPTPRPGKSGGSGGGGAGQSSGASGNTPPVSPAQGTDGGNGGASPSYSAGGGGGAGGSGASSPPTTPGGAGGNGTTSCITGSPVARAGGGGGSAGQPPFLGGAGGTGGGGGGANNPPNTVDGTPGTANTGGGGGGGGSNPSTGNGGNGGSGIVIIRYKFQ
jgi:hypothetical protein